MDHVYRLRKTMTYQKDKGTSWTKHTEEPSTKTEQTLGSEIDTERHSSKIDREDPSTWKYRARECTLIHSESHSMAQGHTGDINRDQVLTSSSFNTQ